jgi:cellulose synthase/poly-beta-1,6-N-acetylglucosamine synthase-like glycosyltransferase
MLGQYLVDEKLLSREGLRQALRLQRRSKSLLGKVLTAYGFVPVRRLHEALATLEGVPFADLTLFPPDPSLIKPVTREFCRTHRLLPWKQEGEMLWWVSDRPVAEVEPFLREHFPEPCFAVAMTSPRDLQSAMEQLFSTADLHDACHALAESWPEKSAQRVANPSSVASTALILAAILAACWWFPLQAGSSVLYGFHLFFLTILLFKTVIFWQGTRRLAAPLPMPRWKDHTLPVYTILIPMYKERGSLPGLLQSLYALDYPRTKLDIKLVTEADDIETRTAIMAAQPMDHIEVIRVPASEPRTKPKACNYALPFARGDYLTIYDAEDRPEPQQLRKAVEAFHRFPPDVVCVQARLNYYNRNQNWLTRLFAIEYAVWFNGWMKGLERLGMPLPLGGTSNHIHLPRLRELCGWDPYNVTEDADLGLRMAGFRWQTRMLDSVTMEEAPIHLGSWIRQRSRWIKGYMQTYLVHMRDPVSLWGNLTPAGFFGFQFFIGAPAFIFLIAPFLWGISLLWMTGMCSLNWMAAPSVFLALSWINLFYGIALHLAMALVVVRREAWKGMERSVLLFPFYWVLHSVASVKAFIQLIFRPHFWEKTTHGHGQECVS